MGAQEVTAAVSQVIRSDLKGPTVQFAPVNERTQMADMLGQMRTENRELLAENAWLRRRIEKLERKK
jgi:hypothetical protein